MPSLRREHDFTPEPFLKPTHLEVAPLTANWGKTPCSSSSNYTPPGLVALWCRPCRIADQQDSLTLSEIDCKRLLQNENEEAYRGTSER